jgi:bacterioferritin-associated ferredoxin
VYICICKAITATQIALAIENGADSLEELASQLGVGTCCGKCIPNMKEILKESNSQKEA